MNGEIINDEGHVLHRIDYVATDIGEMMHFSFDNPTEADVVFPRYDAAFNSVQSNKGIAYYRVDGSERIRALCHIDHVKNAASERQPYWCWSGRYLPDDMERIFI
jgi:hypothetical protein